MGVGNPTGLLGSLFDSARHFDGVDVHVPCVSVCSSELVENMFDL